MYDTKALSKVDLEGFISKKKRNPQGRFTSQLIQQFMVFARPLNSVVPVNRRNVIYVIVNNQTDRGKLHYCCSEHYLKNFNYIFKKFGK